MYNTRQTHLQIIIYIFSLAHRWYNRKWQGSRNLLWATDSSHKLSSECVSISFVEVENKNWWVMNSLLSLSVWSYVMLYEDENSSWQPYHHDLFIFFVCLTFEIQKYTKLLVQCCLMNVFISPLQLADREEILGDFYVYLIKICNISYSKVPLWTCSDLV